MLNLLLTTIFISTTQPADSFASFLDLDGDGVIQPMEAADAIERYNIETDTQGIALKDIELLIRREQTETACAADLDNNAVVGVDDLLLVIGAWGQTGGVPEDLDGNGVVGVDDLLILIGAWGPCP